MVNLVQRCDLAAAADCIDSERNDVAAIVETQRGLTEDHEVQDCAHRRVCEASVRRY